MKKKWMGLLLAGSMMIGNAVTVCAEDYRGGSDWAVQFTGSKMESNFKTSDINDAIYNLQPGDSIDIAVALKNTGGKEADWWMTNKVLQSLEDTQKVAASGGYSYILTYQPPEGELETLYSSDTVGGDKTGNTHTGEGLHEATQSLSEYFYLDTLKAGEQGIISLRVALDGETQGNTYQDTLANLTLNFAVEERRTPTPVPVNDEEEPAPEPTPEPGRRPPKTGDDSNLMLYVGLSLSSGLALLILALYSMHKAGEKGKGGEAR